MKKALTSVKMDVISTSGIESFGTPLEIYSFSQEATKR